MPTLKQYVIGAVTPPNSSIPGVLAMVRGIYTGPDGWNSDLRSIELLHAEWLTAPGPGVIPRLAAGLQALVPDELADRRDERGQAIADWRNFDDSGVRLIVCTNYWASAAKKLDDHKITPDRLVSIVAGNSRGGISSSAGIGRMYLLDQLRDSIYKMTVDLPAERLEQRPDIVSAHELRTALREISHRPRLMDDEAQAPGLDRDDVLVLTLGLCVNDLERYGPHSEFSINRPREKQEGVGYRRR